MATLSTVVSGMLRAAGQFTRSLSIRLKAQPIPRPLVRVSSGRRRRALTDATYVCGDRRRREGQTAWNWRRNAIQQIDFGAVDECGAGVRADAREGGFRRQEGRDQGARP